MLAWAEPCYDFSHQAELAGDELRSIRKFAREKPFNRISFLLPQRRALIEESPVLRNLVQSPRSRDSGNTILSKEFPGGILVMTGANSAVGLRSMAARYLFLDEVDAYPLDVDGEGDPIVLAMSGLELKGGTAPREARMRSTGCELSTYAICVPQAQENWPTQDSDLRSTFWVPL